MVKNNEDKYRGLLLKEGLKDESVLEMLTITKTEKWDVKNAEGGQPKQWTAIYFEVDRKKIDETAVYLSKALKPREWYLSMSAGDINFVVFPNKIFKYKKGDIVEKTNAVEYGKTIGIPESQLDF